MPVGAAIICNPNAHAVTVSIQDAPLDIQRLKRHIALFCDRILKGGKLSGQKRASEEKQGTTTTQSLTQTRNTGHARPEVCVAMVLLYTALHCGNCAIRNVLQPVSQKKRMQHSLKHKEPVLPALTEENYTEM